MSSNTNFSWTFPGGRLVQDVQSLTLVNNTQKTLQVAPGAYKRYIILNVKAVNCDDVARNITATKYQDAAKTIVVKTLYTVARNAGSTFNWPNSTTGEVGTCPMSCKSEILENPNVLQISWSAGGASTGATDADGLVIEYLEMDVS